jgi:ketosteroid isomerase-like protein
MPPGCRSSASDEAVVLLCMESTSQSRDTATRGMSRENVEIVRGIYDAAARRDTEKVRAAYDPEVEWDFTRHAYAGLMGMQIYRGHEGLGRWWREWHEGWEDYESVLEELIEAGDQVITVVTERGRGKASGAEVERRESAGLWTLRDGKVTRVVWFPSREEALEVAGLSE